MLSRRLLELGSDPYLLDGHSVPIGMTILLDRHQSGQDLMYADPIDGQTYLAGFAPLPRIGWGDRRASSRAGARQDRDVHLQADAHQPGGVRDGGPPDLGILGMAVLDAASRAADGRCLSLVARGQRPEAAVAGPCRTAR